MPARLGATWALRQMLPRRGAEELAEQIQLRAGAFALEPRQLMVLEREGLFDALRELGQIALDIAALHAADGADPLGIGRLAFGDFDEQVIAEDPAGGLIAALGFGIAPVRQLADDGKCTRRQAGDAAEPPPALARFELDQVALPVGELGLEPGEPAEFAEPAVEHAADGFEVGDVEQGVFELPLRERAATPIGAGFFLGDRFADQLGGQRAVRRGILQADEAGRDLHIEPAADGRLPVAFQMKRNSSRPA